MSTLTDLLGYFAPGILRVETHVCGTPKGVERAELFSRAARVPGWNQAAIEGSTVLLAGAGGLGGPLAETLARAGVGTLVLADPDHVEASNLHRQRFGREAIGLPKAFALARYLARNTASGTHITAHRRRFEELPHAALAPTLIIAAVDDDHARLACDEVGCALGVPTLTLGLDAEATCGYVLVTDWRALKAGEGCARCFLGASPGPAFRCGEEAAAYAPLCELVAARTAHAALTLLQGRALPWRLAMCRINGDSPTYTTVSARTNCSCVDAVVRPVTPAI